MARQAWQRTITDATGNVLTGVQITVFQADGVTLATIYGQLTGGSALANPFSTGAQTSAKFYADPGRYVVRAFKDGLTQEFTDVDIGGKAVRDDIGTAAYLVATVNAADHVVGRASRVGDFGNGAMLDMRGGSSVPFTNYDQPQKCWGKGTIRGFCDGATLGIPGLASASYGVIEIHGQYTDTSGNSGVQQRFYFAGVTFARQQNTATTWGAWDVVGAPVLGAVAFVSGLSTGAIIERGANSNGDFIKFADGTMVCQGGRAGALATTAYAGVTNLRAGEYTWFFPAAFLEGSVPAVMGHGGDQSYAGWISAIAVSSTQCNVAYFTATVSPTAFIYPIAVGRWR